MAAFRQPAEWDPHAACWVAWPSHAELWGDALAEVRAAFVKLCRAIADPDADGRARGERLEVLVLDERGEAKAAGALAGLPVRFHRIPFGDIWLRDTAPIFVVGEDGGVAAARFLFNGWGGRYDLPGDETVGDAIAEAAGTPVRRHGLVLEGGAVEVDGEGTLLTTRQCLENPNRNPAFDREATERVLAAALGAEAVIWLDRGLENDHTDGHVDTLARFVAPGRVVCMAPSEGDPNAGALEAVRRDLASAVDAKGRALEVVAIPSPGRVRGDDGKALPASYVNFYVANTAVVVPQYGKETDAEAVDALAGCFPGRHVVGVDARAILAGGGAFHCITQPQPVGPPATLEEDR